MFMFMFMPFILLLRSITASSHLIGHLINTMDLFRFTISFTFFGYLTIHFIFEINLHTHVYSIQWVRGCFCFVSMQTKLSIILFSFLSFCFILYEKSLCFRVTVCRDVFMGCLMLVSLSLTRKKKIKKAVVSELDFRHNRHGSQNENKTKTE